MISALREAWRVLTKPPKPLTLTKASPEELAELFETLKPGAAKDAPQYGRTYEWTPAERQRAVLIGVVIATVCMVLFPPFVFHGGGHLYAVGYYFIWSTEYSGNYCVVHVKLLFLQLLALWVVGALLWLLLGSEDQRRRQRGESKT